MADGGYTWLHSDPRGMPVAIEAAIARGTAKSWPSGGSDYDGQKADLRALLVASLFMIDSFSQLGPQVLADQGTGDIARTVIGERGLAQFSSPERASIARVLLETWRTLYVADRRSNAPPTIDDVAGRGQFSTTGGGPPVPSMPGPGEAGFGWPVAAVAIVGVTIQAGVICYCADKVATVIDNELTRREATRQMVSTHSVVLQVLAGHRDAEAAAGTELPLTDAEKAALKAVSDAQTTAQKAIKLEVPTLFPDLKNEGKNIVSAASNLGFGALAIAAVLAYLVLAKGK